MAAVLRHRRLPPRQKCSNESMRAGFKGEAEDYRCLLLDHSVAGVFCLLKAKRNNTVRLLFGSHETSPIIWIGKPVPPIQP
jgi:hypothetical protein